MKRLHIKLTEDQLTALKDAAKKRGMNVSEMIRRCLVADGIIPDDVIQHGGHKERRSIKKKK